MSLVNDRPASEYVPPESELEHALVAIWAEVLGVEPGQVGVETFFMDLGGSSLLLKQVLVRVNDRYQAGLLIPELFKHPTIRELAERLADKPAAGAVAVPVQGDRRRAALLARRQQTNK